MGKKEISCNSIEKGESGLIHISNLWDSFWSLTQRRAGDQLIRLV